MPRTLQEGRQEYQAAYYAANSERRKKYILERQRRIRDQVQQYKLDRGCKNCGYRRCARALHFHHTDGNKEGNIARWTGQGRKFETIKVEMDKCDLLCANCHAEEHDLLER